VLWAQAFYVIFSLTVLRHLVSYVLVHKPHLKVTAFDLGLSILQRYISIVITYTVIISISCSLVGYKLSFVCAVLVALIFKPFFWPSLVYARDSPLAIRQLWHSVQKNIRHSRDILSTFYT